jgi:NADH:ubiquinone oxidoreductase subunit F (NADH-binding)
MTMTLEPNPPAPAASGSRPRRLLAAGHEAPLERHERTFGPLPRVDATTLIETLERSGLTGRGGAGFPAWRKLAAADVAVTRRRRRRSAVVIGNGAEGEPLSWKDAVLLQNAPHLVIDGLLTAAAAVGAGRTILYVNASAVAALERALGEREDAGGVELIEAAETFISGEASAVVNAIENGDPRPIDRVVRLTEAGLDGRPTLLHNVETLAQIALVARYGADWFRSVGTADDPGTRLVTVTGDVTTEGVFEIAGGTRLDHALLAGGVPLADVAAVLVGGYHGAWLPASALNTPLSPSGLAPWGTRPGAGILHVLAPDRCGLAATATVVDYLAAQSARQCGPCLFGLPTLATRFGRVAVGSAAAAEVDDLVRLADLVDGRGACHHPDGTARLVRSALTAFAPDVRAHLHGRCTRKAR